ncbi:AraC family transcriptional regulator [Acinetobacter ihumii]|uniref:AraC family transcriptional regulator n=1 Tax=Acinetobacter ihumii TaxID=2483802 RepID=UPI00102F81DA|nr:AraC family transcriptional regulator [Acinetobacter ihumii]
MQKTFYHIKSVNANLLQLLMLFCEQHGLNLPPHVHQYTVNERVPFAEWRALLDDIEQQYPVPALGLKIANLVQPQHMGILGYIGLSCNNLAEALSFFLKYQRLSYDFMDVSVTCQQDELIISWSFDPYFKAGALADETMIAIFYNLTNQLVYPEKIGLNRVDFVSATPKNPQLYEQYFNCPVEFNHNKTNMYFSLSNLNLSVSQADPVLNQILNQQAASLIQELPECNSFDEAVQRTIIHAVHQGKISIESVAQQLGYTSRMLQYKLKQQGYTFKQRLNQVRKDLAVSYLADQSLSILEISLLLSYQEQTSFNRSFKSWTGLSPLQYRRQIIEGFMEEDHELWNIMV